MMNEGEICTICRDEITNKCLTNSCTHTFCKDCLIQWMRKNNVCPVCRASITSVKFNNGNKIEEQQINSPVSSPTNSILENIEDDIVEDDNDSDLNSDSSYEEYSESSMESDLLSVLPLLFSDSDLDSLPPFFDETSDFSDNFSESGETVRFSNDSDSDSSPTSPSSSTSLMRQNSNPDISQNNNSIPTTSPGSSPNESSEHVNNNESDEPPSKKTCSQFVRKCVAPSFSHINSAVSALFDTSSNSSSISRLQIHNEPSVAASSSSGFSSNSPTSSAFLETSNLDTDPFFSSSIIEFSDISSNGGSESIGLSSSTEHCENNNNDKPCRYNLRPRKRKI